MKKRAAAPYTVAVLAFTFMIALPSRAQEGVSRKLHVNAERLRGTLEKLSEFGRNPEGGVTRIGFSETDLAAREYVARLMKEGGLEVRVDPAGNMFGSRAGSGQPPPPGRRHLDERRGEPLRPGHPRLGCRRRASGTRDPRPQGRRRSHPRGLAPSLRSGSGPSDRRPDLPRSPRWLPRASHRAGSNPGRGQGPDRRGAGNRGPQALEVRDD